jgi:hypothetical protein
VTVRWLTIAPLAVAATLLAAAAMASIGSTRDSAGSVLTLRGHVSGLYPGARTELAVVLRNRGRRPITVRSITTRVSDASPTCGAENLQVSAFRGHLRIGGRQTRRVAVTLTMLRASPGSCQGALFRLVFRARAVG